jgi:uncharacterized protein YraI
MRLCFAVLLTLGAAIPRSARAEPVFPYKAYITADDVYVRSGPGESYYPTSKLNAGAEVEVYRHDPGGWYAIRPPKGSFSWIGARYLKRGQDGLAAVVGERVAVRVGSDLNDSRDVVQVRVNRGEVLELLDAKSTTAGRSGALWCKVSPPSGEFRWVHGDYVDRTYSPGTARKKASTPGPIPEPGKGPELLPRKTTELTAAPKWTAASGAATASPPAPAATPATTAAAAPPSPNTEVARLFPPGASRHRTEEEFQAEFDEINSELSTLLAEDPSRWNTEDLGRRARALQEDAQTAVQRSQVRMLVNRIAQSDDVKRRHVAMNSATGATVRPGAGRGRAVGSNAGPRGGGNMEQFDAVGRLARVLPPKLGVPRYALIDEQGGVRAYVTPSPGVNMQSYLGRQVGINGVRGYIAEQNAEHLTAKHVTALDALIR